MRNKLVFFVMLVLTIVNVSALGITPGRTTFDYESGAEKQISFSVINSEAKDIELVVLVQGDLNESISVSDVSFSMAANEKEKVLSYTLNIPEGLAPGSHLGEIVVIQLPGKSGNSEAFIGAVVGVATQAVVFVPYPGKYAESDLNIIGPDPKGEVTFVMPVLSRGDLNLERVRANIEVFGALNEEVVKFSTNELSIKSRERGELVGVWDANSAASGTYRAVATIIYDEQVLVLEKQFSVGSQVLEIEQIEVNDFSLGEIAKFELLVENKWNSQITGAYAQMQVYNSEGDTMADFKSQTYDIPALSKAIMVAFWDTEGVREGTYNSKLFLRHGQQSSEQDLQLEVSENEINVIGVGYVISNASGRGQTNSLVVILGVVIVVLVLINLLWFIVLRKKFKKE